MVHCIATLLPQILGPAREKSGSCFDIMRQKNNLVFMGNTFDGNVSGTDKPPAMHATQHRAPNQAGEWLTRSEAELLKLVAGVR